MAADTNEMRLPALAPRREAGEIERSQPSSSSRDSSVPADVTEETSLYSTGWVCGFAPAGWVGSTSVRMSSPDGVLQVVVHLDRPDDEIDLDAYADAHESIVFQSITCTAYTDSAIAPLLAGVPTRTRVAMWNTTDGVEISSLLVAATCAGWAARGSASATTTVFADRLGELLEVLSKLSFPFTATSVWAPDAPRDET